MSQFLAFYFFILVNNLRVLIFKEIVPCSQALVIKCINIEKLRLFLGRAKKILFGKLQ